MQFAGELPSGQWVSFSEMARQVPETGGHCRFQRMLLKQEKMVNLLGTIFSCGLIHIWCTSEYSQQRKTTMHISIILKHHVQQWIIECYESEEEDIKDSACQQNHFVVGFGLLMGFVDSEKNIDYNQIYPLKQNILVQSIAKQFHFEEFMIKCRTVTQGEPSYLYLRNKSYIKHISRRERFISFLNTQLKTL